MLVGQQSASNSQLQKVLVPHSISKKFLNLSAANSARNIETIGMIFGVSEDGGFRITHCLLPKQTGTHDSCTTTNEEQIWKFQGEFFIETILKNILN